MKAINLIDGVTEANRKNLLERQVLRHGNDALVADGVLAFKDSNGTVTERLHESLLFWQRQFVDSLKGLDLSWENQGRIVKEFGQDDFLGNCIRVAEDEGKEINTLTLARQAKIEGLIRSTRELLDEATGPVLVAFKGPISESDPYFRDHFRGKQLGMFVRTLEGCMQAAALLHYYLHGDYGNQVPLPIGTGGELKQRGMVKPGSIVLYAAYDLKRLQPRKNNIFFSCRAEAYGLGSMRFEPFTIKGVLTDYSYL